MDPNQLPQQQASPAAYQQPYAQPAAPVYQAPAQPTASYNQSAYAASSGLPLGLICLAGGGLAVLVQIILNFTSVSSWEAYYLPIFFLAAAGLAAGVMTYKKNPSLTLSLIIGMILSTVMTVAGLNGITSGIHEKSAEASLTKSEQQSEQQLQQEEQQLLNTDLSN